MLFAISACGDPAVNNTIQNSPTNQSGGAEQMNGDSHLVADGGTEEGKKPGVGDKNGNPDAGRQGSLKNANRADSTQTQVFPKLPPQVPEDDSKDKRRVATCHNNCEAEEKKCIDENRWFCGARSMLCHMTCWVQ